MVLVSPWLDVTLSDPASESINDPILTVSGLRGAGLQWAGDLDPMDSLVSPLFGSVDGLPPITIYSGSQDLLSRDTLRLHQRAVAEGIDIDVEFLNGGLHGWPGFSFLPEAIAALPAIERALVPIGWRLDLRS